MPIEKPEDDINDLEDDAPAKPTKPEVSTDPERRTTVKLGDEPEPEADRKERRRQAYRQKEEERERLRVENESLRRQNTELHTTVVSRLASPQGTPAAVPAGDDQFARYMADIDERQELIANVMRTPGLTEAQAQAYKKQYYDLNRQRDAATLEAAEGRVMAKVRAEQAQRPADRGEAAIINAEYPDVLGYRRNGDNPAFNWANHRFGVLVAEGKPNTLATLRVAFDEAATAFNIRQQQRPAATQTERQRLGGIPAQAGSRSTGPKEIILTDADMRMAMNNWPHLDREEAAVKMAELLRETDRRAAGQ